MQAQTFEQSDAAYERKDYPTAFAGFKKLAEQGRADAQGFLGWMYANGQGVTKDDQQAVAWFRKAAEQGHADAQHNLGVMYRAGRGVPKDEQQAVTATATATTVDLERVLRAAFEAFVATKNPALRPNLIAAINQFPSKTYSFKPDANGSAQPGAKWKFKRGAPERKKDDTKKRLQVAKKVQFPVSGGGANGTGKRGR